jgi:hypothetical protein
MPISIQRRIGGRILVEHYIGTVWRTVAVVVEKHEQSFFSKAKLPRVIENVSVGRNPLRVACFGDG